MERWDAVRRHWLRILAGGLISAAGALIVSAYLPEVYRARTYVLVSESRIGESSDDTNLQQMAMLATFVPFVDSDAMIAESLAKLKLDRPPHNLTVDLFRRRHHIDVRTLKSTRLLELSIEFPDGRIAAELANEIAQGAVRFNDRLNTADTTTTQDFLEKQLDRNLEVQAERAARRLEVLEEARIEDQERDLAILLAEKDRLSVRFQQLRLDLVRSESRSQSLEEILASEPEVIALTKNVISDRFLELAAQEFFPEGAALSVTEESLNETREAVRRNLIDTTVDSTAQRAEIEAAAGRLDQIDEEISALISRLNVSRVQIEAAEEEYERAVEATRNASREYQTASVTVGSKTQDMKQIAPAMVPGRPVRPNLLVNTATGFLLGVFLAGGGAIGIRVYRELPG